MATGAGTPGAPPPPGGQPTQKVSDVISAFRPVRRFKTPSPSSSSTNSYTSITSLDFDDSGELAVLTRDDNTLQVYNCREGKHAKELKSEKYGVHLARFSHHAQNIIYASTKVDDAMRYVSTHDNSFLRYFKGHTDTVTSISLSPASDQFISCSKDNTVRLWNLQSNNYFGLLNLHAPHLAVYDPSATVIAVASPPTHSVLLYDVRNFDKPPFAAFDLLEASQRFLGPSSTAEWTKIEFTNDGKSLVVSTTGSGHFVLDAFEGNVVHFCYRKAGHSGRPAPGSSVFNGVKAPLGQGDTCVSPDGQYLIGGSSEEGLLVWDISKPATSNNYLEPVETLPGTGKAAVVGYNPRSNLIASGDKDFFLWQPDADLLM